MTGYQSVVATTLALSVLMKYTDDGDGATAARLLSHLKVLLTNYIVYISHHYR